MSDVVDQQQAAQPTSTAATSEAAIVSSGSSTGLMKRLLKRCKGGQKEVPAEPQRQQQQRQQPLEQVYDQPPQQQQPQLPEDGQRGMSDEAGADTDAGCEQTTTACATTAATTIDNGGGGGGVKTTTAGGTAAGPSGEVTASGGSTTSNNHGQSLLPRLRRSVSGGGGGGGGGKGKKQGANSTGETPASDQLGAVASHNTAGMDEDDDTALADQQMAGEEEPMTESKATGDDTGASQSQQQEGQKQRTRSQIFRSNDLAARKRAEKFWTVDNEEYNFKSALHHYTNVDKHVKPKDMKFIVDHRKKQMFDDYGKVMRTVIRGAIHPLVDNVVMGFCQRMGMSETQKVPTVEERMFLWFHRERAIKHLPRMGPKQQVYFVNFINWDHVLTDLQSLNSRLRHCSLSEGQTFMEHYCHDPLKIRELFTSKYNAKEGTPMPKMLFIDKQTICPHIFESQEFNSPCQEKECPNYGRRMCRCFQMNVFIPETLVLATKREFERVLKNFIDDKYFSQRWMIRASNLKSGNGIQFIDSASELETFLRYDIRRRLRGQFFIMQRYLKNPMLMGLRRFDCRMFLMICVLTDRRVLGFLHPGYVREAQKDYDPASNDLRCHITLPFTWDPDYNRYKGANPEQLPDYCHPYTKVCGQLDLPLLDFRTFDGDLRSENYFVGKINCMAQEIVRSMESIIFDKPGTWQLFGLDIAVDNEKNPWLYDVITYPCIGEPDFFSETQNRLVPAILTEALTIVFELNQRDFATRSRLEWMDLPDIPWNKPGLITAQQNFIWMYSTSPERLLSNKDEYKITRLHWYHQWRVTEDFNDYILYLKNFRLDSIVRTHDSNIYGRKTFDHSPVFKLKQQLKKNGFKLQ